MGDEFDEESLMVAYGASRKLLREFLMVLEFYEKDQKKLKCIHSRLKEKKREIRKLALKTHISMELFEEHYKIELRKLDKNQYCNIPELIDFSNVFKKKIIKLPDLGNETDELDETDEADEMDEAEEVDHVEYAMEYTANAIKEFIIEIIFYLELKELEKKYKCSVIADQKEALPEHTSSVKEFRDTIIIETKDEPLASDETPNPPKFLQIFKEGGYDLFCYLDMEYTIDDISPVAKYSYLYHFLAYEQLIIARSQSKYMEFIKDTFGINMSKILPENDKFNDDIHPLLSRLKSNFDRKYKSELNLN